MPPPQIGDFEWGSDAVFRRGEAALRRPEAFRPLGSPSDEGVTRRRSSAAAAEAAAAVLGEGVATLGDGYAAGEGVAALGVGGYAPAAAPFQPEGEVGTPFRTVDTSPGLPAGPFRRVFFSAKHTDGTWEAWMTQAYAQLTYRFRSLRVISKHEMLDPTSDFYAAFTTLTALRYRFASLSRGRNFANERAAYSLDVAMQEEIIFVQAQPILQLRRGYMGADPRAVFRNVPPIIPADFNWPRN